MGAPCPLQPATCLNSRAYRYSRQHLVSIHGSFRYTQAPTLFAENAENRAGLTGLSTALGSGSIPKAGGLAGVGDEIPGDLALARLNSGAYGPYSVGQH